MSGQDLPHAARMPAPRLPSILRLPDRPRQPPLNGQQLAAEFDRFVSDPESRVMYYPWPEARRVRVPLVGGASNLVELGSRCLLAAGVTTTPEIELPPHAAYVVAVRPAGRMPVDSESAIPSSFPNQERP